MRSFAMHGRRIPVEFYEDTGNPKIPAVDQPGDYCGPITGYTGREPAVFFLKPNARDPGAPKAARTIQHVVSPPHKFIEEADGTLTITDSIGNMHTGGVSDGWHGYLVKGDWFKE